MPASGTRRRYRGVRAQSPYHMCVIANVSSPLGLSIPRRCILDGSHRSRVSSTPVLRRSLLLLAAWPVAHSYVHLRRSECALRAHAGVKSNRDRGAS
jgi:hypothetical protein